MLGKENIRPVTDGERPCHIPVSQAADGTAGESDRRGRIRRMDGSRDTAEQSCGRTAPPIYEGLRFPSIVGQGLWMKAFGICVDSKGFFFGKESCIMGNACNLIYFFRRKQERGMAMVEEFKKFIMRGNVLDMAVGVIIGAAFGKIVTSFVSDILMPPLGLILGKVDFSNLFINLSSTKVETFAEAKDAGLPVIAYGAFLNNVVDFLIVAFAIFMLIKQVNRFMPQKEADPDPRTCPYCKEVVADDATRCPHCTSELK